MPSPTRRASASATCRCRANASRRRSRLEHDPEKWIPVFRKDHAPLKSVRQWNELGGIARHDIETPGLPVRLGGFDAFLARGDEIPPDVARPIHGGAADHDEVGVARRPDG